MQRSSATIGTIAAALARAQLELTNPEKSLTATVRPASPRDSERTFRYASLSSGLDIVRKSLGKHEIATVQTTAIDKDARLVRLTTVLAHSSGEWMSSEWPVCPISDTAFPQRMGAALTYARRYALFTLVGIAGEDDLDAPDLADGTTPPADQGGKPIDLPVNVRRSPKRPGNGHASGVKERVAPLAPEPSSALRDEILAEVAQLTLDRAAIWARDILPKKNCLTSGDAKRVEDAFAHRLSELGETDGEPRLDAAERVADDRAGPASDAPARVATDDVATVDVVTAGVATAGVATKVARHSAIDKSLLFISEPKRHRDKNHLRFVASHACLVCGRRPSDAHHLKFMQPRALGRKVSDEFTVPLCRGHHRAAHRTGNERSWWQDIRIDPIPVAAELWDQTRQPRGQAGAVVAPAPDDRKKGVES